MLVEPERGCYVRCATKTDFQPGVGLWVYSPTTQVIELTHDQSQVAWEAVTLNSGWNLVGVDEKASWKGQAIEIWQWLDGEFRKLDKTNLTLGEGYWVKKL